MDLANIKDATEWFEVLQTSKRTQTAMMTLAPGEKSGCKAEAHEKSDQVLLMLSGKLSGTCLTLRRSCIKHLKPVVGATGIEPVTPPV